MRHEGSKFSGMPLELDGNEYVGCTFEKCTFVFRGGETRLDTCSFDTLPRIEFEGPAAATVALLINLYHGGFRPIVEQLLDGIRQSAPPGTRTN